jgi:hypothetical protein
MAKKYRKYGEMETCPNCSSLFIQYDEINDQCYCLACNHRWEEDVDFDEVNNIKNDYLRISIRRIIA